MNPFMFGSRKHVQSVFGKTHPVIDQPPSAEQDALHFFADAESV